MTTHFENPELIGKSIYDTAIDNLSVGLDPDQTTFVQQSRVPAIAELTVYYSMLVSVNALRHNPTVKTEARQYGYDDLSYGFLGYPVSQAADITFCGADLVPVGEDQLPHMEQARKIVRRFNRLYGETIKLPEAMLSGTPRLVGLDGGSKMGKSLGNAIYLSDDEETVTAKIKSAQTDPNRITLADKGNPDICTVSSWHRTFNGGEYGNLCEMCRNAQIGCTACKGELCQKLNALLSPFRERRAYYERRRPQVREIILNGTDRANRIGAETMARIRSAMHMAI